MKIVIPDVNIWHGVCAISPLFSRLVFVQGSQRSLEIRKGVIWSPSVGPPSAVDRRCDLAAGQLMRTVTVTLR